jgi:hypothetical protein
MATQVIERLIYVIDELLRLLSYDEYADAEIAWRVEWLHQIRRSLQEASSKETMMEVVQEMRRVVRGGMGAFLDIYLSPKPECGLSKTEMNERFDQLTDEFYMLREQLAEELEEKS